MTTTGQFGGERSRGGQSRGGQSQGEPSQGEPDAWARYTLWNAGFWLFMALVLLRLGTATELPAGRRAIGLVAVGAMALAYVLLPLRPAPARPATNLVYLAIAIAGTWVACAVDPTLGMLLFIVYPHVWVFSGTTRAGVLLTALLSAGSAAGFLIADGWSVHGFWLIGPSMAVSLLFSVLMGLWVSRIIDQSRERAALIEQLKATRSQLNAAHHAQGVGAERERLAREIHDTLAQGFTSIVMLAQAARALLPDGTPAAAGLTSIEDVARDNLREARALVAAFSPVALDGTTLTDAIARLTRRFGAETGLAVSVQVSGELARLSRDREVVLLRATQEALTNVRRHARATLVTVRLSAVAGLASVEVLDDGVGFATAGSAGGFGLTGMRDRVHEVGGEVDVDSAPSRGTRVSVRLPVAS